MFNTSITCISFKSILFIYNRNLYIVNKLFIAFLLSILFIFFRKPANYFFFNTIDDVRIICICILDVHKL